MMAPLFTEATQACAICRTVATLTRLIVAPLIRLLGGSPGLRQLQSDPELRAVLQAFLRSLANRGLAALSHGVPLHVTFDISMGCNLACRHCYAASSTNAKRRDLSTEEAEAILDDIVQAGAALVDFGGGEPLLRQDIYRLLAYAKARGLYASIVTNGTLLDDTTAKALKSAGTDHVSISLDFAAPERHDSFRGAVGTHARAVAGMRACVAAGLKTEANTTIMRSNRNELAELHSLLLSVGVAEWRLTDFIPAGSGAALASEALTASERKETVALLDRLLSANPQMSIVPYHYSATCIVAGPTDSALYRMHGQLTRLIGGCMCGRLTCHIASDGIAYPCFLLPVSVGDLRKERLADFWYSDRPPLSHLRDRRNLSGMCRQCRHVSHCGGCRAKAFASTGSYLADPGDCWVVVGKT